LLPLYARYLQLHTWTKPVNSVAAVLQLQFVLHVMLLCMYSVLYLGIIIINIITAISELLTAVSVCELFPPLLTISVPSVFTVKQSRKKGTFETSAATRPTGRCQSVFISNGTSVATDQLCSTTGCYCADSKLTASYCTATGVAAIFDVSIESVLFIIKVPWRVL